METGELWEGQGLVVAEDSDLYISVSEEMQTVDGEVEKEWETRVPTSLTIVQAESAALLEKGLPCFCEDKEEDSTIIPSSAKLVGSQNNTELTATLVDSTSTIEPISQSEQPEDPTSLPPFEGQITF